MPPHHVQIYDSAATDAAANHGKAMMPTTTSVSVSVSASRWQVRKCMDCDKWLAPLVCRYVCSLCGEQVCYACHFTTRLDLYGTGVKQTACICTYCMSEHARMHVGDDMQLSLSFPIERSLLGKDAAKAAMDEDALERRDHFAPFSYTRYG